MKKLFYTLIVSGTLFIACDSKSNSNEAKGDDVDPYRQVGVENVNGNIPDTTGAIDLGTSADTSNVLKDSTRMDDSSQNQ